MTFRDKTRTNRGSTKESVKLFFYNYKKVHGNQTKTQVCDPADTDQNRMRRVKNK